MKVKVKNLATLGLPEIGKYELSIERTSSDSGVSDNGFEWERADVNFRIVKDAEGNERNGPIIFDKFFLTGNELSRFFKLYSGTFGYLPDEGAVDGEGEPTIDTDEMLTELEGKRVWAVVLHDKKNTGKDGRYGLKTGWAFGQSPEDITMPRIRDDD